MRATRHARAVGVRRLSTGPLADAIRLWYLGAEVPSAAMHRALGSEACERLIKTGFLRASPAGLRARVRIVPFQGLLVAHDRDDGRPRQGHVLGVGGATRSLASLTVPRPGARFLDLGSGSGTQALLAARSARWVVASDLNPRATQFIRANAALNGLEDRIDARTGDLFLPVHDERFDVVVSNPPFVVSPDRSFTFRDGGRPGDAISRAVVRGAAEHLAEGGYATVLVNWIVTDEGAESRQSAPVGWVDGLSCDALILRYEAADPVTYAARWIVQPADDARPTFEQTLDRWLAYLEQIRARSIVSGAIALRRRSGANWTRVETMRGGPTGVGGRQIERIFAAHGQFGGGDRGFEAAVLRPVDGHRIEQHLAHEAGAYRPHEAVLRLDDSAGVVAHVPADLLELLFALDGRRSLATLIADVAAARDQSVRSLRRRALPVMRAAFENGFLAIA